jgi:DNA mismatch repair ATPase MutS
MTVVIQNSPLLSLLWPVGTQPAQTCTTLDPQCVRDLELESTLAAFTDSRLGRSTIREVFLHLCTDPAVIAYRQDILEDLWCHPDFTAHLEALLPDLQALDTAHIAVDRRRASLQDITWRLGELEHLVSCVTGLSTVFAQVGDRVRAQGWCALRDRIGQIAHDAVYQQLTRELPDMLRTVRAKVSVTIGVNLDGQLRPVAATLLSVNEQKFTASTFLDRLFGRQGEDFQGLGPLHMVPDLAQGFGPSGHRDRGGDVTPLMVPLFRDVAKVLETVCQPIARALRQYNALHSGFLATLHGDLAFYLAAVRLLERLRSRGLPVCRPDIVPMTERVCTLREAYNLNLALHQMAHAPGTAAIVTNDVAMDDDGRICILTGPNQGGKTTYTHMLGLCQLLAQTGLWVPAAQARLSPVDNIYTHYPVAEHLAKGAGRFGEEAQRLCQIFAHATRYSLILLNESLASTNPGESLYIAQDMVRILRRLGARVIFATHLHELAAAVDALNASTAGESRIVSLVASRTEAGDEGPRCSYKIVPGPPLGRSYAREIAAHYGISADQLTALLQQRGIFE